MPFPAHDITFRGKTQSISHWARETGIPAATIRSRLFKFKWDAGKALTTPPNRRFAKGGRRKADAPRPCPELQRHADGRAFCRWTAGGRDHWRTFGDWGSAEAKAAYRRFSLEWAAGAVPPRDGLTPKVGDLVEAYFNYCKATYRKRGKVTSEVHLNRSALAPLNELYGHEPADEFAPAMLRAVREAMVEKGWVRDTVNAHTQRVVRAFAWGVTALMVPPAVHAALALVEAIPAGRRDDLGEGVGVEPVPAAHVAAVLEGDHLHPVEARREVLAAMVRVQLLTGMRPGELCALTADQIDRRRATWRYAVGAFNKMLHRDTVRVVLFGPKARAILGPFLDRAAAGPVFRLPPARKGAAPSPVTTRRYRDYVHAACASAGVPPWSPNQLRHTRATELLDRYEDDEAVAVLIGHSPEVLRRVYAKNPGEGVARRIAEATG